MRRRNGSSVSLSSVSSSGSRTTPAQADLEAALTAEDALDFSIEELREFVSADLYDVPADPQFKEDLRELESKLMHKKFEERSFRGRGRRDFGGGRGGGGHILLRFPLASACSR